MDAAWAGGSGVAAVVNRVIGAHTLGEEPDAAVGPGLWPRQGGHAVGPGHGSGHFDMRLVPLWA